MASKTKEEFEAFLEVLWGSIPNTSTANKLAARLIRDFSHLWIKSVSVTGGVLELDLDESPEARFSVDQDIDTNITISLTKDNVFQMLTIDFVVNGTRTITFPAGTRMQSSDTRWTGGVLTLESGVYSIVMNNDGTNYKAVCSQPYLDDESS